MDQIYRENIIYHYKNPQYTESIKAPTHKSKLANYSCGDEIELELEIKNGVVKNVAHKTTGCAISVAGASILSEFIVGKKVEEISKMDKNKITELMGIELSPSRLKCALLSLEAFRKALGNQGGSIVKKRGVN